MHAYGSEIHGSSVPPTLAVPNAVRSFFKAGCAWCCTDESFPVAERSEVVAAHAVGTGAPANGEATAWGVIGGDVGATWPVVVLM
jgi:hypothetical protein